MGPKHVASKGIAKLADAARFWPDDATGYDTAFRHLDRVGYLKASWFAPCPNYMGRRADYLRLLGQRPDGYKRN